MQVVIQTLPNRVFVKDKFTEILPIGCCSRLCSSLQQNGWLQKEGERKEI